MRVHVFGNSPSPAVATYGLRKTAQLGEDEFGTDMRQFVERNFYVDDGLVSLPTARQAVDLMQRTQLALSSKDNLRLHKIASNNKEVMSAFPVDDHAQNLKEVDLGTDMLPLQRSLGLIWDLELDTFMFQKTTEEKPYTKRGVLSIVNSLFDPLGFLAPVVIQGKMFLRDLMSNGKNWDEPLPVEHQANWDDWRQSLKYIETLQIPRTYAGTSFEEIVHSELHIFSDASEKAIAAVAYLKTTDSDGDQRLGFVLGKAKVAPTHGHTIPRLELCAAVLAAEIADMISNHLDMKPDSIHFYTDSKVILGYIHNETRRFHVYVCNRVDRIRRSSSSHQWTYVSTNMNPADQATRSLPAAQILGSTWLTGPAHILKEKDRHDDSFPLVSPDTDQEIKPHVSVRTTNVSLKASLGCHRFERFSQCRKLVKTIANLKHVALNYHENNKCKGWHICPKSKTVTAYKEAESLIIREAQQVFQEEIRCILVKTSLPRGSPLFSLDPFIDTNGILRVGGRLRRANLSVNEKHPIIIPARHHIATLLIRHYHQEVRHQGRHFTEGAIRAAGYWIIGGKRLISSLIHSCVTCCKLRGRREHQKMADLPSDRLKPGPAFSHVGVDTFGPWSVVSRRTRGGQANSKRWAILFTCLASRGIHIEVIEEMSASCFINALRRFIAIRGKVTEFRSDRGTNFVGSVNDLKINAVNVEDGVVKDFLYNNQVVWTFNPPHSSHMGGVWERMIGITRRILDSIISEHGSKNMTHEVLTTFMAEVCAIVNARPVVPVSSDPDSPDILSPSTLLTLKTDHVTAPDETFDLKDLYKSQWRRVQVLADMFWTRWRREYLQSLQGRRKWQEDRRSVTRGDVVLQKEKDVQRNEWPIGLITNALPGEDRKVRKAVIRVVRGGKTVEYTRPITEMIVLLAKDSTEK